MTPKNYELDNIVSKTTKEARLLQTEKGIVELRENALVVPIIRDGKPIGYVLHGQGRLLIDAIVETREGAIGKSIDRELNDPFLMLGNTETIIQYLTEADEGEFTRMGYKNQQEFTVKAQELLKRFFNKKIHHHEIPGADHVSIFAFSNADDELDILVVEGSKLVYNSKNTAFVSNKDKTILKSPNEVIVSNNGKSVIIKNGKSLTIER